MTAQAPKPPADIVAYYVDVSHQLLGDEIRTATPTVDVGTVVIEKHEHDGQAVRLLLSGGSDLEDALITIALVTRRGQEFSVTTEIPIRADVVAVLPATVTKRFVINQAFTEMGLAGYEFDATPEEQTQLLLRLDAMMAQFLAQGINLGYNQPTVMGQGDLDDPIGIPDDTLNAIWLKLAERAMPAIGKTMSPETRRAMNEAWNLLTGRYMKIPERALGRNTPIGAGNKPWSVLQPFARRRVVGVRDNEVS